MDELTNPYDCSSPGNLFTGYVDTRKRIVRGLKNGSSYAILGGRRCGKTSLLLQLEKDLSLQATQMHVLVPRILDMQAVTPRSPADFFRIVYEAALQDCSASTPEIGGYQSFLKKMDDAKSCLDEKYGPNWIIVLLIDELEAAVRRLADSECLENLRNLLTISRFKRNFRSVATGVFSPAELAAQGSPLNNLNPEYLAVLGYEEVRELVDAGFRNGLDARYESLVLDETGSHPYILQGVLGYLFDAGEVREGSIHAAARRFVRDRDGTFRQWMESFRPEGRKLYQQMLDRSLREVPQNNALAILSYHCVIDESAEAGPQISGTIFREWFRANHAIEQPSSKGVLEAEKIHGQPRGKSVFVVHGRNMRIRNALFTFLRALGLEPLEWTALVEATGTAAPHINEILRTGFSVAHSAVVLLTPDDEARVREEFRQPDDPEYEWKLSPQPRPNVLFEAGMAMAHFPERTVLVQVGWNRPFTDIAGIHAVRIDNSIERRRDLARRLRLAGCEIIDLESSIEWQRAGDFSLLGDGVAKTRPV